MLSFGLNKIWQYWRAHKRFLLSSESEYVVLTFIQWNHYYHHQGTQMVTPGPLGNIFGILII